VREVNERVFSVDEPTVKDKTKAGSVVQVSPFYVSDRSIAGCLMTVTGVYRDGVSGYIQVLGKNPNVTGGQLYTSIDWSELAYVGEATWACIE
jgi:hypothetical protein